MGSLVATLVKQDDNTGAVIGYLHPILVNIADALSQVKLRLPTHRRKIVRFSAHGVNLPVQYSTLRQPFSGKTGKIRRQDQPQPQAFSRVNHPADLVGTYNGEVSLRL